MEFTSQGRTWLAVGREPYTRKDGRQVELQRWQIKCAQCDATVEVKTPVIGFEESKAFGTKHCPAHKLTQAQVMQRWNAQRKANKQEKAGSQ